MKIVFVGMLMFLVFEGCGSHNHPSQATIEKVKASFLKQPGNKNVTIDSTYVGHDTLFYYGKGVFIGKSIIKTE